jgi:hypothetical protein
VFARSPLGASGFLLECAAHGLPQEFGFVFVTRVNQIPRTFLLGYQLCIAGGLPTLPPILVPANTLPAGTKLTLQSVTVALVPFGFRLVSEVEVQVR